MSQCEILRRDRFYIGGEWRRPAGAGVVTAVDPTTERPLGQAPEGLAADVDAAVAAAQAAFRRGEWRGMGAEARIAILEEVMRRLGAHVEEISSLVTREMGAPIWMRGHFDWALGYWADIRDSYRAHPLEERRSHPQGDTLVVREPIGVVAGIVPWNAPLLLAIEKAASALITGCTCVIKPAAETPLDAFLLAEAFEAAGAPPGVFNLVTGGRETGERLVSHPGVNLVSLTGSTLAGRRVGEICGRDLRRASLELGGKSAAVVLEDADMDVVARAMRFGAFISTGQACNLLSRVLAPRRRYDEALQAMVANAASLTVGDPGDPATEIGPLAMRRQRERVEGHIALAQREGARLVAGGGRPAHLERGFFIEPTVFADVTPQMTLAREEVFGPVLAVIPYEDEADALRLANDSDYGLGGAVFSADVERAIGFARGMEAGSVGINRYGAPPNAPFGGYKASGLGREHGPEGIEEHLIVKSIALA